MSGTTNLNMRVSVDLLARIDAAAQREGVSRTAYILSWLPDTEPGNANTAPERPAEHAR